MKTNKYWYPYSDVGTFYKLDQGVLMFCPMSTHGRMFESESGEVELDLVGEEIMEDGRTFNEFAQSVIKELKGKA